MQLLTKTVLAKLPALYSTEDLPDDQVEVVVRFFVMWSHWSWYAAEGSYVDANGYCDTNEPKVDFIFFGWIEGDYPELGYFRLSELEQLRGSRGFPVERDLGFRPTTLQALMATVDKRREQ